MPDPDFAQKKVQYENAADNFKAEGPEGSGKVMSPPKSPLTIQKKGGDDTDKVTANSVKTELETEHDRLKEKHGEDKTKIFDGLAAYIASKTKPRRLKKKKGGTKYAVTKDSMKLSGNTEAMEFLHKIGYWKDKPRRLANAAKALHGSWSEETDESGNRTRSLSELGEKDNIKEGKKKSQSKRKRGAEDDDSNTKLMEIIGLMRPSDEDAKSESKDAEKGYSVVGGRDRIIKSIRKGKFAWSAATISYIHHLAGSGDTFAYSEGHVTYAKASKANNKKDNVKGIEKLHKALGKDAEPVKLGDTLHRSRGSKSTFKNIKSKTHSDVVVGFKVYKVETTGKGKKKKTSYTEVDKKKVNEEFAAAQAEDEKLTRAKFFKQKNYQLYAVVIGGNTSDWTNPGKETAGGDGGTVGQNFIPLNPDFTVKARKGRNSKKYSSSDAYFGVQRTDHEDKDDDDD